MNAMRRMVVGVAALVAAGMSAGAALGQWEEPTPIQAFKLMDWSGKVFTEGHYRRDDETRASGKSTETDRYFEEGVELKGDGYLYHPNMVDWSAVLRVGFTQQDIGVNDDNLNSDGTLLGYDIFAIVLKEKPVSARVFASLTDQFIDRAFAQPIDLELWREGFEIFTKSDIPLSVLFEHTKKDETTNLRADEEESYYAKFHAMDRRDPDWLTDLTYEHEDTEETLTFFSPGGGPPVVTDLPDRRDELNVLNRWEFGPEEHQHSLVGSVRALRRQGFLYNDYFLFDQRLTLRHTETFSSFYEGQLSYSDTTEQTQRYMRGSTGVSKRFYQSLDVTARVVGVDDQYNEGRQSYYGGFIDADYRKQTPVGRYTASMQVGREYQDESFDSGTLLVIDEPITLNGLTWERLTQPNVVAGTVLVTDVTNAIVYFEGVDYMLRNAGAFVEIQRILGGGIADGQTVLVDYTVDRSEADTYHTDYFDFSQRLTLKGWPVALYSRLRIRNDTLDGGIDPGNLDRETRLLGGVEVTLGQAVLTGEYEQYDSELAPPWWAYRFAGAYFLPMGPETTANFGANYEMLQYREAEAFGLEPGEDFLESYGGYANVTSKIQRHWLVRLEAQYLKTRGRDDQMLARIGPSVTWSYGLTEISVGGYYSMYEQEDTSGMTEYVDFRLTRRF